MAVLVNENTRVICQGFTGSQGTFRSGETSLSTSRRKRGNKMKSLLLAAALSLLTLPALADENTESARAFITSCAKQLPDTRGAVKVLKSEGWRYESSDGTFHFYSRNGRRVLAATTVTSSPEQGCFAVVSKLSGDGAIKLAKVLAKQFGLKAAQPEDGALAVWTGKVNGVEAGIGAMPPGDFYFLRGASVILLTE